jgi:hypothetical protein
VNCAVTYAFSLYVQGRTNEGLEILQKLPRETLHEPHNAVYAAVLFRDVNQNDIAKEYAQAAKRGPLYAEEKRLLEDEVAKSGGASPSPTASPSPKTSATASTSPTATPKSTSTSTSTPSPSATPEKSTQSL